MNKNNSAGKGDRDRSTFKKIYKDRFPKLSGKVEGFVKIKGKLTKKY
jgi:hypothetical protein